MHLNVKPSLEHIKRERRQAYLAAWPLHEQLEAHAEAAAGRPEKLNGMLMDFSKIRAAFPLGGGDAI